MKTLANDAGFKRNNAYCLFRDEGKEIELYNEDAIVDNTADVDNNSHLGEMHREMGLERIGENNTVAKDNGEVNDLTQEGSQTLVPALDMKKGKNDMNYADVDQTAPSLFSAPSRYPDLAPRPQTSHLSLTQTSHQSYQHAHQRTVPPTTFGPSKPIHLIPTAKRSPQLPNAPVQSADMNQRCWEGLDNSLKYIRDYLKGFRKYSKPIPHYSNKLSMLKAVQRVILNPAARN